MGTLEFNIEALPVKITYVGETVQDTDWQCDQWKVEITYKSAKGAGFWTTDYFTGLGHRKQPAKNAQHFIAAKPVKPKVADVLYALFRDADAANYNFDDWCDNYDYSNDSLKALNIYERCLETSAMLRRAFDADTRAKIQSIIAEM